MKLISKATAGLAGLLIGGAGVAFPPAPHHTLYGMVRNQWGDPISIFPSDVYLETPSGSQLRTSLAGPLEPGVNYRLEVPMDSGTAPDLYLPTAMRPFFPYRLKVVIGQTTYLPIEMAGNFAQIGRPAESTRIDLTLGEDLDGDGLPDAWEQGLIALYGGTLSSINPNDDSDGDGISNLNEYLAGTYAFDPADGFRLDLVGLNAGASVLEWMAIRGRTYTLQASSDLKTWSTVSFRIPAEGAQAALRQHYPATDVRTLRVEVPAQAGVTNRYFKALVQ
jgi:hypothetical protein